MWSSAAAEEAGGLVVVRVPEEAQSFLGVKGRGPWDGGSSRVGLDSFS